VNPTLGENVQPADSSLMPSPEQMLKSMAANLPARTGKTLEQWVALLRAEGPADFKARLRWLKQEHAFGQNTCYLIAHAARPADYAPPTDDALLDAQYAGPKAALRPIYEALTEAAGELGSDVGLGFRKTYVSLARQHQFALIQPSTRTRVDLGLRLPDVAPTERLEPAGSFGSGSVTHRVRLASVEEVDAEVREWLRAAYEARG